MSAVEDVRVGTVLPEHVVPSVDAGRMRTMAALIDDPVPIHYDVEAVRAQGLGDREVNQGPMAFGYLVELVGRWAGDVHAVSRVRCRFHTNVFAGDRLVCSGVVVAVDPAAGTCDLELEIRRGAEIVVSGGATARTASVPGATGGPQGSGT